MFPVKSSLKYWVNCCLVYPWFSSIGAFLFHSVNYSQMPLLSAANLITILFTLRQEHYIWSTRISWTQFWNATSVLYLSISCTVSSCILRSFLRFFSSFDVAQKRSHQLLQYHRYYFPFQHNFRMYSLEFLNSVEIFSDENLFAYDVWREPG